MISIGWRKRESELAPQVRDLPTERKQASLLSLELKEYMPRDIQHLLRKKFPEAVSRSIERACLKGAEAGGNQASPLPVLLTVYRDTTLMQTATVIMTKGSELPSALRDWEYLSQDWSDIKHITAPDLSPRERYALDKQMNEAVSQVEEQLGFRFDSGTVEAYKRFHRFYPLFQLIAE